MANINRFIIFIFILFNFNLVSPALVNKCCAEGEQFDENLYCVPINNNSLSKYYWLPDNISVTFNIRYNFTPCDLPHSKQSLVDFIELNENGDLKMYDGDSSVTYKDKEYCMEWLDWGDFATVIAYVCPCLEGLCLYKCCTQNKHMLTAFDESTNSSYNHCVDSEEEGWHHGLVNGYPEVDTHEVMSSMPDCHSKGMKMFPLSGSYYVTKDGSIFSDLDGIIHPSVYCGDYIVNEFGNRSSTVFACLGSEKKGIKLLLYGIANMLGALFLAVTTFIYIWLPELGGLPRWTVVFHAGSLMIFCICLALQQLYAGIVLELKTLLCYGIGYTMQFSFLAAFFWLNVMCLDMSWTFSAIRAHTGANERDRKKFIIYSLYAWGGPTILTLSAIITEYTVSADSPFKPNVGVIKCWFRDRGALWLFFYGPMAILLLMNMIFFIYTLYRIVMLRRGTKALRQGDSATHGGGRMPNNKDKQKFILYGKLFLLMGVTWLTEIISWLVGGPNYYWYFTDAINLSRAVFIFIIFCWKPKVWAVIKKRVSHVAKFEEFLRRVCPCCFSKTSIEEEPKTTSTSSGPSKPLEMKKV